MKKKAVIIVILAVVVALIIGTLARPVDMGALDGYVSPFYATPLSLLPRSSRSCWR